MNRAISTHAPRTGSDICRSKSSDWNRNFNPRSPHGERPMQRVAQTGVAVFQPTLPARGATLALIHVHTSKHISTHAPRTGSDAARPGGHFCCFISTHAPRTGSDVYTPDSFAAMIAISTHAPRTGSDTPSLPITRQSTAFQPTLPARGATLTAKKEESAVKISTHAPRTGSDHNFLLSAAGREYFNPRSPHGERLSPLRLMK